MEIVYSRVMTTRLDSDLLRSFVAIAEAGSLTRAGERIGRTQSALSVQLRQLETAVGTSVFARGPRGVVLTRAGERLLSHARRVLAALAEAERAVRPDPLRGPVRIGIAEEYGSSVLPAALARFATEHPGVEVTIRCGASTIFPRALHAGELDLAVAVADGGQASGEPLGRDPTVWVTSSRHDAHEADPLPLALFEPGCWWRDDALAFLDARRRPWRVACTSASIAGVGAAVGSGMAVAVMGLSTVPGTARILTAEDGFEPLRPSDVVLQQGLRTGNPAVEGMRKAIREAFAGLSRDRAQKPC